MANVLVNESSLSAIADAIRSKNGSQETYKPSQMAEAIHDISGGGITPTGAKQISITANGTTTEDVTNYASAEITVNVPSSGGSGVESGTFIGDGSSKTISVPVSFQPNNIMIYSPHNDFGTDTVWNTAALLYHVGEPYYYEINRYGTNAPNTSAKGGSNVSYANGILTISSLQYALRSGKTYYWFAW